MEFLPLAIQEYVEKHSTAEDTLLSKIDRDTHHKVLMPRMLSGHLQGRVLAMLSHMIQPKNILEIGTYTGYSAICLAEGLTEGGKLTTIDINEELEPMVKGYFEEANITDKVRYIIGNALDIIPPMDEMFDLVFIDADKISYYRYFEMVIDKVPSGGYIIADNVLWSGKVVDNSKKTDKDTQAIMDFNRLVHKDPRVTNVLFPIRDGLMVLRKK